MIYQRFRNPGIFNVVAKFNLKVTWVVEAGCHDGKDTLKFAEQSFIKKIYAFEPDIAARSIAERRLNKFMPAKVKLFPYALMEKTGPINLNFVDGTPGSGNSQVVWKNENSALTSPDLEATSMDNVVTEKIEEGILWLDVEGNAVSALLGGGRL